MFPILPSRSRLISILLGFLILASITGIQAVAQEKSKCGETSATVTRINGDYSFTTAEGINIGLTSMYLNADFLEDHPELESKIGQRLVDLLSPQPLQLQFSPIPRSDACFAQVINANGEWVQEILLQEGLAYAAHKPAADDYFITLLQAEMKARRAKTGIWEHEDDLVVQYDELLNPKYDNSYRIIEGYIRFVRDRRRIILTCLTKDPWKSLCMLVMRDTFYEMRDNKFDLMKAVGSKIRVRGDIWPRDGLKSFIDRAELIEILEEKQDGYQADAGL